MNTVDFIWNGQTLHLLLNGAALFDIFDRYGSDAEILELIAGSGRKDLEATSWPALPAPPALPGSSR